MLPDKRDHHLTMRPMQGYIVTKLDTGESIGPLSPQQLDDYYMGRLQWQDAPHMVDTYADAA